MQGSEVQVRMGRDREEASLYRASSRRCELAWAITRRHELAWANSHYRAHLDKLTKAFARELTEAGARMGDLARPEITRESSLGRMGELTKA